MPRADRRLPVLAVLCLMLVVLPAAPASAHPFGPPLTARLSVDGTAMSVRWSAEEDDWVALGRHVGAFAETPMGVDGVELTGLERLQRSERLRAYLLDQMIVSQDGVACAASVDDLATLRQTGMTLRFRCPAEITVVDVQLSALTDVHEAYRTVATGPSGAEPSQVLYTAAQPVVSWDLSAAEQGVEAPTALPRRRFTPIVVLLVVAAAGLLVVALRGGSRRSPGAPPPGGGSPLPQDEAQEDERDHDEPAGDEPVRVGLGSAS